MGTWTRDGEYVPGKVEAAQIEKNLWKRRANIADSALKRIRNVFRRAEDESDDEILAAVWEVVKDWESRTESDSTKQIKVKAYIFPLTDAERDAAEAALENWYHGQGEFDAGVDAVLEAVANLRDPATSRGLGA